VAHHVITHRPPDRGDRQPSNRRAVLSKWTGRRPPCHRARGTAERPARSTAYLATVFQSDFIARQLAQFAQEPSRLAQVSGGVALKWRTDFTGGLHSEPIDGSRTTFCVYMICGTKVELGVS
jgi:hypothetical protein